MAKGENKNNLTVRVDEQMRETVSALAERLGCTASDIFRDAIPVFVRHLEASAIGEQVDVCMAGDAATQAWKRKILELAKDGYGPTEAAYEVKMTPATVRYHLKKDPVFRQLFEDAKDMSVERMDRALRDLGLRETKPHVTAMIAYLNAHHPDYGPMRPAMMRRQMEPFFELIGELADELLSTDVYQQFMSRLADGAEQVIAQAFTGKG